MAGLMRALRMLLWKCDKCKTRATWAYLGYGLPEVRRFQRALLARESTSVADSCSD